MSNLKPMLAETLEDSSKLSFPVIASPKLDGIRCLIVGGKALSRSLKPIPNASVQAWVAQHELLNGLDGELIVGDHDKDVFQRTTSGVMSKDGPPIFTYWVFDVWCTPLLPYRERIQATKKLTEGLPHIRLVPTRLCASQEALCAFEEECLSRGYEGAMVRKPDGHYKYGRSSIKEGLLLKVKRFRDDEAEVVGWGERMHNENVATTDALGHMERSTHKAGMKPAGDLGYLKVRDVKTGIHFDIGSGFTAEQRVTFWKEQSKLMGRTLTYKHFPIGVVERPRFPTFKAWRDKRDTSD